MNTNGHTTLIDTDLERLYGPLPTAPQPCPEAAFSCTIKGLLDGHETLLTIRGQTPAEFQRNLASVRGILDGTPSPAPATPALDPGDLPRCPEHGNFLRQGRRGMYCPTRRQDGTYCAFTIKPGR